MLCAIQTTQEHILLNGHSQDIPGAATCKSQCTLLKIPPWDSSTTEHLYGSIALVETCSQFRSLQKSEENSYGDLSVLQGDILSCVIFNAEAATSENCLHCEFVSTLAATVPTVATGAAHATSLPYQFQHHKVAKPCIFSSFSHAIIDTLRYMYRYITKKTDLQYIFAVQLPNNVPVNWGLTVTRTPQCTATCNGTLLFCDNMRRCAGNAALPDHCSSHNRSICYRTPLRGLSLQCCAVATIIADSSLSSR